MTILRFLPSRVRTTFYAVRQDARNVLTALRTSPRPVSRTTRSPFSPSDPGYRPTPAPSPGAASPEGAPEETCHPPRVYFQKSDVELELEPDQSILDAGLDAGLDLRFSCTLGGCAACALEIVEGEVCYEVPICLTDEEIEDGLILACVGRPNGRIVVDA